MIRAVLDANVLASGLLQHRPEASPAQILDAWRRGDFELVLSPVIIAEVERTLSKPYFTARLSEEQIAGALRLLRRRSRVIRAIRSLQGVVRDADDDLILATALSATADCLVSGDGDLLDLGKYATVEIVTPRDLLRVLQN